MPVITSATVTTPTADPAAIAKEKLIGSFIFGVDSPSAGGSHPIPGGLSDCTGGDFLIGGIRTVIDPDSNLQKVYKFFASVRGMEHEQLFTEFNVGAARQISLSAEKDALLKATNKEIRSLKDQLVLKEAEVAEAIHLCAEASNFEAVEKSLQSEVAALKERNNLLETDKSRLDVKVADLAASVKVREQEVTDLDAVVTSVKLQNDNLVDQVHKLETSSAGLQEKLAIAKYLNSTEYLFTLGAVVGKAVEKGMQDGLSARITHGAEGRVLTDVVAYNPSAEADFLAVLQHLQSVNFSLIAELKFNKDASIDTIMNLLRIEDNLAKKLGFTESQPHVDQLMVPIHHSSDQHVVGTSTLSRSLDVSSSRVRRIKENIAQHRSAFSDVFVLLSERLFVTALTGTQSTLNVIPATVDTTTALFVTSVSTSLIPPISTDDYEVAHAEGGDSVGADVFRMLTIRS
uniref:Uncharacterized protein n=1 Tax=Tanacetum cinerariifolium TaxID=118510 RepID=A0A6L2NDP0_TANCI|nr:hypothetical protein [Tanacetum cinerariifolium]